MDELPNSAAGRDGRRCCCSRRAGIGAGDQREGVVQAVLQSLRKRERERTNPQSERTLRTIFEENKSDRNGKRRRGREKTAGLALTTTVSDSQGAAQDAEKPPGELVAVKLRVAWPVSQTVKAIVAVLTPAVTDTICSPIGPPPKLAEGEDMETRVSRVDNNKCSNGAPKSSCICAAVSCRFHHFICAHQTKAL